ncbi:acyl carrier protein [Neorhizobium sp. T786]|uniref:acyl carrier protein n=1 Tax=Pseudorhizobium xiangyangii TaxID=2883104 RepID=UPI001D0015A7|nr:acyl carrier protein [Neorhizobium xiangyangii]MCB5204669.1 acyl carrier protein [Neorhizobium xiangyangii]
MSLTQRNLMDYLQGPMAMSDVSMSSELFSTGLLDSVSMVNLIAFIEQSSGHSIRAEDVTLENFDTPERILRFTEAVA